MNKLFSRLACMAAFCVAATAQAELLNFNMPVQVIDIDNDTFVATYKEGGFRISGDATSFLPLDNIGASRSDGLLVFANMPITLMAAGGGLFSLLGLDYAAYDSFDDGLIPNAILTVSGLVNGGGLPLERKLPLNDLSFTSVSFDGWKNLTKVSFVANDDFVLDNINVNAVLSQAIPEPASLALVSVALAGLTIARRRNNKRVLVL